MAEENVVILINNSTPFPSGTRGVRSEIRVGANGEKSQANREVRRSELRGRESRTTHDTLNAEILKKKPED